MGKKHIKVNQDGIIDYTDNYRLKMEHNLARPHRQSSTTEIINTEQMAAASPPDFRGYYEAIQSAMSILNSELYRAYNGKIPLKDYERYTEKLYDHQCDLKIDIDRDKLKSGRIAPTARKWQRDGFSWKEAMIDKLKKKYPEINNLGRQKDGHIR